MKTYLTTELNLRNFTSEHAPMIRVYAINEAEFRNIVELESVITYANDPDHTALLSLMLDKDLDDLGSGFVALPGDKLLVCQLKEGVDVKDAVIDYQPDEVKHDFYLITV